MVSTDWVEAKALRMTNFRFSAMHMDVPSIERLASGGHIDLDTNLNFSIRDGMLVVTHRMMASMRSAGSEKESEDSAEASIEVVGVATYEIPEGVEVEDGSTAELTTEKVEGFMHMLEPILMLKLKAMLADAGARGVAIPPHVYVPNFAKSAG